ncbi:MAG: glycosyltransferase family 4 protein [Deltaproteobacteria bacterium]|nr:glycosyltransferase family 4 protein [Deltaproteobacteria bacterium]
MIRNDEEWFPMKILQVNKFYYLKGGAERYLFELKGILEEKGHEVIIFSMRHPRNEKSSCADFFVSNVDFNSPKSLWDKTKIIFRIIYFREAKRKIEVLIKEKPPEVAHLHNIAHQISPSILISLKKAGIPTIQTLHDYKLICPTYRMLSEGKICERCKGHRYYHAIFQKCNKGYLSASLLNCLEMYIHKMVRIYEKNIEMFIAPSNFLKEKLIEFGIDPKKLVHIPNFIRVNQYLPQYQHSNYFVYFGRISEEKGIATLIKAMRKVKGAQLYIVGEGKSRKELERFTHREGAENIKWLGYKGGEELKSIIKDAMFVALPSECYENCPMSLLEAYALGKPVIGSNIGGIPEIVEDGITGFLFEPGNPEELAEKINHLIFHPRLIGKLGKNSRERVEREYSPETHYQKIINVYQSVLR